MKIRVNKYNNPGRCGKCNHRMIKEGQVQAIPPRDELLEWKKGVEDRLCEAALSLAEMVRVETERDELRAEVDSAKRFNGALLISHEKINTKLRTKITALKAENERLAGEVERVKRLANIRCGYECIACGGGSQNCHVALLARAEKAESALKSALEEVESGHDCIRTLASTLKMTKEELDEERNQRRCAENEAKDWFRRYTAAQSTAKEQFRAGMESCYELAMELAHEDGHIDTLEFMRSYRAAANEQGGEGRNR